MTIAHLVPKPRVDDEVRESVLRLMKDALVYAEAGDVDTVIMILGHPEGHWTNIASNTAKISEAIGRLEITKQEWINKYLEESEG